MTEAPPGARVPTSVPSARPSARPRETVTAVVVTRGATEYLPRTLAAVAGQTRPPQRLLVVDAAPGARPEDLTSAQPLDGPLADLAAALPTRVVTAPGVRTFGGAVRAALADDDARTGGESTGDGATPAWLWLLHDDSAPEPGALAALVRAVEVAPSVVLAGAKQLTWSGPARVVEVGVTTSRFGRRMTGIDEPEVDQGQHDAQDDVLAVGLAGALVRRDVWDELGGPDPALGPYGDGLDLSRRARLAGHRVVVVPGAAVRHARASLGGGRPGWDPRRSARARREAFLHAQLVGVPGWLVPAVAVLAVLSGVVRALGRVVTKEPQLVAGELLAPWRVLSRPGRVVRARRRQRRTSVLSRRTLRPLEATWRDVVGQVRDRRLASAEARRVRAARSELELAELAALRRRRRGTLAVVAVLALALDVFVLGPLVGDVLGGARLTGGSLLHGDVDLGGLWAAATSWWAPGGLGHATPPEPLLAALLPFVALTGGLGGATALLLLGSLALAALGAWFAAGAATRSVALRAWAALVWTAAPALLVGLEEARLGAVLAHVLLPWFALLLARGVGAARTDAVTSGLVGARRLAPRAADASAPAAEVARPRYVFDAEDEEPDGEPDAEPDDEPGSEPDDEDDAEDDEPEAERASEPDAEPDDEDLEPGDGDVAVPATAGRAGPVHPPATTVTEPSLAAAAAAALVLAVLTAAAPVLLPATLVLLLAVAPVARRRVRLVWVALPALALHGPVVAEAVARWDDGGWRLLVADPGAPVAGTAAPAWQQLLGWPVPAEAWSAVPWSGTVADVAPLVASGVVLLLALPALWLRAPVGRAARIGWVAVAVGTAAALVASGVTSGVVDGQDAAGAAMVGATASPSPGLSLALAGALCAALLGATGLRTALARYPLGWRHAVTGLLLVLGLVGPVALLGVWAGHARDGLALRASDAPVVPTVGRQLQSTLGLRVLVLEATGDGVRATLLRGDGRQLTETSRAVELDRLLDPPDAADAEVAGVAARLAAGASATATDDLAALAVGAVLVPPHGGDGAASAELAAALDATPGLERVTSTASGVIWRVAGVTDTAGWARVVAAGTDGQVDAALPAPGRDVTGDVPPGTGGRILVLAERADEGWRATVDGQRLRAVDTTWRQAFELDDAAGDVTVEHAPAERVPWLVVQGVLVGVTVLLAVPMRRRRGTVR